MTDLERIEVVRVKESKSLETDEELVHRFAMQLYKDIKFIEIFVSCDTLSFTPKKCRRTHTSKDCEGCFIFKNNKCGFKIIKELAHDLMWKTKPEKVVVKND